MTVMDLMFGKKKKKNFQENLNVTATHWTMFRFAYTVHLKIFDALIKTKKTLFLSSYRQQLSYEHVWGLFWYVSHKHCGSGTTLFTGFGLHSWKIFFGDCRLTDHWHRRHHYCRRGSHDAHVNWDHWRSYNSKKKSTFKHALWNGWGYFRAQQCRCDATVRTRDFCWVRRVLAFL